VGRVGPSQEVVMEFFVREFSAVTWRGAVGLAPGCVGCDGVGSGPLSVWVCCVSFSNSFRVAKTLLHHQIAQPSMRVQR
jgi:hypothetical protein